MPWNFDYKKVNQDKKHQSKAGRGRVRQKARRRRSDASLRTRKQQMVIDACKVLRVEFTTFPILETSDELYYYTVLISGNGKRAVIDAKCSFKTAKRRRELALEQGYLYLMLPNKSVYELKAHLYVWCVKHGILDA